MKKSIKQPRKPAHSPGEWAKLISAWKTTSLSKEEFAAKNNITVTTLQRYCSMLKNFHSKNKTKTQINKHSPPEFIPVKVVGQTNASFNPDNPEQVELALKNGHVIRLHGNISASKIAEIFRTIIEKVQC